MMMRAAAIVVGLLLTTDLYAQSLFPWSVRQLEPPTGCTTGLRVLTYGDSKTVASVTANNNQMVWQDVLRDRGGCSITINIGTGPVHPAGEIANNGYTVATRQQFFDSDMAWVTDTPDVVLFNLGSNDCFHDLIRDDNPDFRTIWETNLAYIWDGMHAKWPNAQIYYSETWRQGYDSSSDLLATWYAGMAASRPFVHLCDNERDWVKGSDNGATMFWDGIHFSVAGAKEKARLMRGCLALP